MKRLLLVPPESAPPWQLRQGGESGVGGVGRPSPSASVYCSRSGLTHQPEAPARTSPRWRFGLVCARAEYNKVCTSVMGTSIDGQVGVQFPCNWWAFGVQFLCNWWAFGVQFLCMKRGDHVHVHANQFLPS